MTTTEITMNTSTNEGVSKSSSLASLSSNSNSSTENLIQSLSMRQLNNQLDQNKVNTDPPNIITNTDDVNRSVDITATENPTTLDTNKKYPQIPIQKKPIKFKVRKVSHETIETPYSGRKHSTQKLQNGDRKSTQHLKASQDKYDLYVNKIEKINKEIDFLVNLLPPFNVEIDYATRSKITRAIEKLKMKQDELEKKKYSLGITISRLWRDCDESDIWIRSFSNQ